jgi:hypothetical protein
MWILPCSLPTPFARWLQCPNLLLQYARCNWLSMVRLALTMIWAKKFPSWQVKKLSKASRTTEVQFLLKQLSPSQCGKHVRFDTSFVTLGHTKNRKLLTHSSGIAYDFAHPNLFKWSASRVRTLNFHSYTLEGYTYPLVFEPGEGWVYGAGIDCQVGWRHYRAADGVHAGRIYAAQHLPTTWNGIFNFQNCTTSAVCQSASSSWR